MNYSHPFPNVIGLSGGKEIGFWLERQMNGEESVGWGGGTMGAHWTAAFQGLPVQLQARPKVSLTESRWGVKEREEGEKIGPYL